MLTGFKVIHAEALRNYCREVLVHAGVSELDAAIIAEPIVEADLRGVHSHGVQMLPYYFERFNGPGLNARPEITVVHETPSFALLNGDNGIGHLAGFKAMQIAIEKARTQGVSLVGVNNTNHYGMGAYYPMLALKYDMVGFATCNNAPCIAPWGGASPRVGNNPISIAVPTNEEIPVVLDISMSVVAAGRIMHANDWVRRSLKVGR